MHLFCYLLLALSLNRCLKAVQTIATYIEVINAFQVLKMFLFFRRFNCVIFAHAINTDVWHAIDPYETEYVNTALLKRLISAATSIA